MKTNTKLMALCEGAIMVALSIALSYVDIPLGFQGGSINLTMIPIIIYALRYGCVNGICAGLVFGTLKFFIGGGAAVNWQSMLLDYTVAYGAVGFAGLFKNVKNGDIFGTLVGGFMRFIVHFISGVTIYAEWAENTYLGISTPSTFLYSVVYNAVYMVPSIVLAVILVPIIFRALKKYWVKSTK